MSNDTIILHNYPQSPVAEKVRLGLGLKNLTWANVLIPRIPPKPDLVALTGGYRRTPVMQIGADIYCDSQCILGELQRRFPTPTFFPNQSDGLAWGISRWGEQIFTQSVKLVLGAAGNALPADFAEDRGRLYFGPDWQNELADFNSSLPRVITQLRSHLSWIDDRLAATGQDYIFGNQPGVCDLELYYFVWFIRGRWDKGPEFLSQFEHIVPWEQRISEIGHGVVSDMSADEALEIARQAQPQSAHESEDNDPQGLKPGMKVSVVADVDGGETHTVGLVASVEKHTISIMRFSEHLGELCVYFPKAGYRIDIL